MGVARKTQKASKLFDPPRWQGGPVICIEANLPAFPSAKDAEAFHKANGSLNAMSNLHRCEVCDWWHYDSQNYGPAGASSGTTRYHKEHDENQK